VVSTHNMMALVVPFVTTPSRRFGDTVCDILTTKANCRLETDWSAVDRWFTTRSRCLIATTARVAARQTNKLTCTLM